MRQDQYEFVRCIKWAGPLGIAVEILIFIYETFFDRHPQLGMSVIWGLILLFSIPAVIWLTRQVDQYEKEHFHTGGDENDSSHSSKS